MTEVHIVYWRDIPSLVKARAGRRNRANAELAARFQEAIDGAAMRARLTGTDAYMDQWRSTNWQEKEGDPQAVADQTATEVDALYSDERLRMLVRNGGVEA